MIDKPEILYHITKSKNLQSIMTNGLLPCIGDNCKLVKDKTEPVIFLCTKDMIRFFYRNFNHYGDGYDCILKINIKPYYKENYVKIRRNRLPKYNEYGCFTTIRPDDIEDYTEQIKREILMCGSGTKQR